MSNESRETVADIVAEMRYIAGANGLRKTDWADRIEAAAKRGDDVWRAAFAKVTSVVSRQHAKRNLGEQGSRAVAEIMSACRFADGALDEYERAFAENARLRAALEPVLEADCQLDNYPTKEAYMAALEIVVSDAQRIYDGSGESEVKE